MTHKARRRVDWWLIGLLLVAAVGIAGLGWAANGREAPEPSPAEEPAYTQDVEGTDVKRVVLSEEAADRLGLQTAKIAETTSGGKAVKSLPYAALLYDAEGEAWAYARVEPLVFMRQKLTVDHVAEDTVTLTDGPAAGTDVVIVGGAELQGVEYGVGEE